MITVVDAGKRKSIEEFFAQKRAAAVLQRKSIRWVLFGVRIMRENFPQKATLE